MKAIAIDGPAGSGKSTIAKGIAERLKITYLDTGALYRACTWYLMEQNVDLDDERAIADALMDFNLKIKNDRYIVKQKDVTDLIRTDAVTDQVSKVSAYSAVRDYLLGFQQDEAEKNFHVVEGRDIGTRVLPDAELKIFLTASPEVRAKRRMLDEKSASKKSYEEILKAIQKRDAYDSNRKISPLRKASDAVVLDSSDLTIDQVVEKIVQLWIEREGNDRTL